METQVPNRRNLKRLIDRHFNLDDVRSLCFDLHIEFDNLPPGPKIRKIESLIENLDRRNRLFELVEICQEQRPDVEWGKAFTIHGRQEMVAQETSSHTEQQQRSKTARPDLFALSGGGLPQPSQEKEESREEWLGYLLTYHDGYLKTRGKRKYGKRAEPTQQADTDFRNITSRICHKCASEYDIMPLIDAFVHPHIQVRKFTLKAVGEIGSRFSVDQAVVVQGLINLIQTERESIVKRQAIWALGAIRPIDQKEQVRKTLIPLLLNEAEDTAVRWRAAWALGEIKEGTGILAYFARQRNVDENIRYAAIRSLGAIGSPHVLRELKSVTAQESKKLQKITEWAMHEIQKKK